MHPLAFVAIGYFLHIVIASISLATLSRHNMVILWAIAFVGSQIRKSSSFCEFGEQAEPCAIKSLLFVQVLEGQVT